MCGWPLWFSGENGIASDVTQVPPESLVTHGFRPDYGSGPHLLLMAMAVKLARLDLLDPSTRYESERFLRSDLVALFAECIGFDGSFVSG